jgi:sugar/nucleoside kinase (ribokinase family)
MGDAAFDVVGIGNAIVDILAQADDAFIQRQDLNKGSMALIDSRRAEELYGLIGPAVEASGGSAANTMAGLASLGGRGAYIGKVAADAFGKVFAHDMRAIGVHFDTPHLVGGAPTARSIILITPDGQRTMNTYLGACVALGPDDIDPATIESSAITYLEGYLWDRPEAKAAFEKAAAIAHRAGRKVALTLSDPFCVERHRESFKELVKHHVDILFANDAEIVSLYQTDDFDDALQTVRWQCGMAVLTRSARGSVVLDQDTVHIVDPVPVAKVVDTTGAGDQYAAGFLYGFARGFPPKKCAKIASVAAGEVIGHIGPRPQRKLAELI